MKLKKFVPVITTLLDVDLYKFTMWQVMFHRFTRVTSEYDFFCRNTPSIPLSTLKEEVEAQIDHLCTLRFTEPELEYLGARAFIQSDFVDFLRIFQFQRHHITVSTEGDALKIHAKGPIIFVMFFEIFVLSIVNELYYRQFDQVEALKEARKRLAAKIDYLKTELPKLGESDFRHHFEFFDFGGRRRFSSAFHEEMVGSFAKEVPQYFRGSSNVHLARKYGITPIGTMAHEYLQMFQRVGVQLKDFQKVALETWAEEYRGKLGIALTDVVGMDAFLADFDYYLANIYDGMRHDSGNPVLWAEKALKHYEQLGINAHSKRLVFSDGLTLERAVDLYTQFGNRIACGFGIGTFLSNDTGIPALNIIMKLVKCNGESVAKLSDSAGKTLCKDEVFLSYLRQSYHVNP